MRCRSLLLVAALACGCTSSSTSSNTPVASGARASGPIDWAAVDSETMKHFQALLRMDTRDPPGNERPTAAYLVDALRTEGIEARTYALEPSRPNVVARIRGSGKKKPLLLMGHQDVVNVDTTKWHFPPFSATRDSGYVYARGSLDDKTHLVSDLMLMLLIKRRHVPLDRDVIMLAEGGEEGSTRIGIQYMVDQHWPEIDAEYCLAEGGGVTRVGGQVRYAGISTTEKIPRAISLTSHGIAGHGSIPLRSNTIVHLAGAIERVGAWRAPVRLNETTTAYFRGLAAISPAEKAARYLDAVSNDPARVASADDWFSVHEPVHSSMLRTSISPTMVQGGYRVNVIPSEATATLDVRMVPGEDATAFLDMVKKVVNDTAVDVKYAQRDVRPASPPSALESEAFKAVEAGIATHYNTVPLPAMLTGATDMAYLRAKGMQCYGTGVATDIEDGPKGYGPHGDQERVLEKELFRFVHVSWDIVMALAKMNEPR